MQILISILLFIAANLVLVLFALIAEMFDIDYDLDNSATILAVLDQVPPPPLDDADIDDIKAWNDLAKKTNDWVEQFLLDHPEKDRVTPLDKLLGVDKCNGH